MSDMHAETAMWIDGLRKRADKCEGDLRSCPTDHKDTVAARDRLQALRKGLDRAGPDDRSDLERMAVEVDQAMARARARM